MNKYCDGDAVIATGTLLEVKATKGAEYMDVGGVSSINGPQITRAEIDVTRLCDTAKRKKQGLRDNGSFSFTIFTMLGNPGQQLLLEGLDGDVQYYFRLSLPDDGYKGGPVTIEFEAGVTAFPISAAPEQAITSDITLQITGDLTITYSDGDTGQTGQSAPAVAKKSVSNTKNETNAA